MILSRLQELSEFLRFAVSFNEISVFENQVSIHKNLLHQIFGAVHQSAVIVELLGCADNFRFGRNLKKFGTNFFDHSFFNQNMF